MPPPYYGSATNHFACGSTLREDRGYIYLPHMHSFRQWEAYHSGENICGVFIGCRPLLSLASFELATEFPFVRRNIHVQGKEYVPSSSWHTPKTLLKPQNDHTTYFFQIHVKLRRRNVICLVGIIDCNGWWWQSLQENRHVESFKCI